jgi:hypothetical protein
MTEPATCEPIRDGDVFDWSYRDKPDASYWCKSRIAIATDGRLRDTFWSSGDDASWSYGDAAALLNLTLRGNLNDFEPFDGDPTYYDPADIMNLNHSNSSRGNLYRRKGAQRSIEAMLAECRRRIDNAEGERRSAEAELDRLRESEAKLKAGDLLRWL